MNSAINPPKNLHPFPAKPADTISRLRKLPDTRSRIGWVLTEFMQAGQTRRDLFEDCRVDHTRGLMPLPRHIQTQSGIALLSHEIIKLGKQNGEIRQDIPPDILAALFAFAFIEVAQAGQRPEQLQAQETIEYCIELMIHGLYDN